MNTFTRGKSYELTADYMVFATVAHMRATGEDLVVLHPAGTVLRCDVIDATGRAFQDNGDGTFAPLGDDVREL